MSHTWISYIILITSFFRTYTERKREREREIDKRKRESEKERKRERERRQLPVKSVISNESIEYANVAIIR